MKLQPGTLLTPNLRLERQLGQGGMGTVWIAHNRTLNAQVAVKMLHSELAGSSANQRFEREARSLAQIDSPHVVRVFDYGLTVDDEPYIVMEMLRGKDLREHIEQQGPLSVEQTTDVVTQLCRALRGAHDRGVVHRDIKPANVFLVETGDESLFLKVLDFGVAKFVDNLGMTTVGTMVGTPYYMSPEQLLDSTAIDARSDLWSVAVLAYACLAGALPFHGKSIAALSIAIHNGTFAPMRDANPKVPAALDAWMLRALKNDPAKRFQTANELATTFAQAAAQPAETAPPSEEQAHLELGETTVMAPTEPTVVGTPTASPSTAPTVAGGPVAPAPSPAAAAPQPLAIAPNTMSPSSRTMASDQHGPPSRRMLTGFVAVIGAVALGATVAALYGGNTTDGSDAAAASSADANTAETAPATTSADTPAAEDEHGERPADEAEAEPEPPATVSAKAPPVTPRPTPTPRSPVPRPKSASPPKTAAPAGDDPPFSGRF